MSHSRRRVHIYPLPFFLVTLARSQKAPEVFKLKKHCNIVIKVEAYRSQTGLHSLTIIRVLATSGCIASCLLAAHGVVVVSAIVSAQRNRSQSVPIYCNCAL
jgi:hypothetical protein